MNQHAWAGFGLCPDLEPVLAAEVTDYGWRGLTAAGELLEVRGSCDIPDSLMVYRDGVPVGTRKVMGEVIDISEYLSDFTRAALLHRANRNEEALAVADRMCNIAPTSRARFNRVMILLALGRWREGFDEFERCERYPPFQRPLSKTAAAAGIKPWFGEDLRGKRLLLLHDHGFGDSVMMLRFVPLLQEMGAHVVVVAPRELRRMVKQFCPVTEGVVEAHYFSSLLMLLKFFSSAPVPPAPYVSVNSSLWYDRVRKSSRRRVGLAWSVGVTYEDDYPRAVPLEDLVASFDKDVDLYSVQKQGAEEARSLGVQTFDFADFTDVAELMSVLDEVVTVDTAAVHVAGATGHPNTKLLLSHWASWRWFGNPFYPAVKICQQDRPGDWASALRKLDGSHREVSDRA